jgi:hypothetical protein
MTTARVRTRIPLRARWSHVILLPGGTVAILTHIWATRKGWERREESHDRTWMTFQVGFVVVACRIEW